MFSSRFLINIKDHVAGLSCEVPPSDHLTREFIMFRVQAEVMWISVYTSHFSQRMLCLMQSDTMCNASVFAILRPLHCPPPPSPVTVLIADARLPTWAPEHALVLKWGMERGIFRDLLFTGFWSTSPPWGLNDADEATASAPWRAPQPQALKEGKGSSFIHNLSM